jgi:hypothetical protein
MMHGRRLPFSLNARSLLPWIKRGIQPAGPIATEQVDSGNKRYFLDLKETTAAGL